MNNNPFIKKLESKSNLELENIAKNSKSFVFDARYAAIKLLKNRNFHSTVIKAVQEEGESLTKEKATLNQNIKQQNIELIKHLSQIPIKETKKYKLKNGNQLQVKRLNQDNFQIRIEDFFRSALAPVIIFKIKNNSTYFCYPFLYLNAIMIYGFGGVAIMTILFLLGYVQNYLLILPLFVIIGFQLILMPLFYFIILHFFKQRLIKKLK